VPRWEYNAGWLNDLLRKISARIERAFLQVLCLTSAAIPTGEVGDLSNCASVCQLSSRTRSGDLD